MRRLAAAFVLALPLSCAPKPAPADFSGLWKMTETDVACKHEYSSCWVLIRQEGDRATVNSWGGDGWTCTGRGSIEGSRFKFRWGGGKKDWNGSADLERIGNELKGTYQRDEVNAAVQYTRGVFVRKESESPK